MVPARLLALPALVPFSIGDETAGLSVDARCQEGICDLVDIFAKSVETCSGVNGVAEV